MSETHILNTAVIGAGMISAAHCTGYSDNPHCQLVAVSDPLEERAKGVSARFGVKSFTDYHDILADESIDLVSVCTPDHTHADIAVQALEAGKHVVLEKPMATTLEDCDRIIDAMRSSNRQLTLDFEYRYNPFFHTMKELVDRGELGELKAMSIYYWRHPFNIKPGRWVHNSRYTTMMIQEGCHYVDLLGWICGEIETVWAWSAKVREDVGFEQILFGELAHKNGVHSQYSHTVAGNQIIHNVWLMGTASAIYGTMVYSKTQGSFAKIMHKKHTKEIADDIKGDFSVKCFGEKEIWDDDVIPNLINDFVSRIIQKRPPGVTAYDGRKSIEVALAMEESARRKSEVALPLDHTPDFILARFKSD